MLRQTIAFAFKLGCCAVIALQLLAWGMGFDSIPEFFTGVHHAAV